MIAPARLARWRLGGSRRMAVEPAGALRLLSVLARCLRAGASTAGSRVTDASLSLRLFFRGFFPAAAGKLGHHGGVREGRGVAQRAVLADVAEQPADGLARPRLGQRGCEEHV